MTLRQWRGERWRGERWCGERGAATLWILGVVAPAALVITGAVFDAMMAVNHRAEAQDFAWAVASAASAEITRDADGTWVINEPVARAAANELAGALSIEPRQWQLTINPDTATVTVDWAYEAVLIDKFGIDSWDGTATATANAQQSQ